MTMHVAVADKKTRARMECCHYAWAAVEVVLLARRLSLNPNPNNLYLVWGNALERQAVFKILASNGCDVDFADEVPNVDVIMGRYSLIIIDYDTMREPATAFLRELERRPSDGRPIVLMLSASKSKSDLYELLSTNAFTNLLAKDTEVNSVELLVTVQKLLRDDIFGFDKYLAWGIHPQHRVVHGSKDKGPLVEELETYLRDIGCNKRLATSARTVADELIMNAVYNAPVDGAGVPKYASRSRSEGVMLEPNERAQLSYACDGRYLALSVADRFGRLRRETVVNYLRRCFVGGEAQIEDKDGGAGLGLYYIFESLNHFVVNIAPNQKTEIIGLIDISGTYRNFSEKSKSLNIFLQRAEGVHR
ncbi:MAG: hypothetical protein H7Z43_07985 [Clostridia bacterium]|nr:hypothetical protein [Deltaproteobacteria bacterium]